MNACGMTCGQTLESGSRSPASAYPAQKRHGMGSGAGVQQAASGRAHSSGRCTALPHTVPVAVGVSAAAPLSSLVPACSLEAGNMLLFAQCYGRQEFVPRLWLVPSMAC